MTEAINKLSKAESFLYFCESQLPYLDDLSFKEVFSLFLKYENHEHCPNIVSNEITNYKLNRGHLL